MIVQQPVQKSFYRDYELSRPFISIEHTRERMPANMNIYIYI